MHKLESGRSNTSNPYADSSSAHGFTLIELLCVLSIMLILCAILQPTWQSFYQQHRLRIAADAFSSAIQAARLLAMTTKQYVVLCGSRDQKHCTGDWSSSQITSKHPFKKIEHTDNILGGFIGAHMHFNSSLGHDNRLVFLPSGWTQAQTGSFFFKTNSHCLRLVLLQSGSSYLQDCQHTQVS